MNPIAQAFQGRLLLPSFIEPDFDFLPTAEVACALYAYRDVSGIVSSYAARPAGVLFDIDGTLQHKFGEPFVGRTFGALYAFANAGIPVGIFSMRPDELVQAFLQEAPEIAAMLAVDEGGERLAFGNSAFVEMARDLCRELRCGTLFMEIKTSKADPKFSLPIPALEIGVAGYEECIHVPKFSPSEGVIVVDDCDYRVEYKKLYGYLYDNGEYDVPLYGAALMSSALLWHVGKAEAGENFSAEQLQGLRAIMSGIAVRSK